MGYQMDCFCGKILIFFVKGFFVRKEKGNDMIMYDLY